MRLDMFNDFEKHCLSAVVCLPRVFSTMLFFSLPVQKFELHCIWYTLSSVGKSFTKASFNFNGPLIIFPVKDRLMDCFINLPVLTRDITWFLSFLFSPCNNITTVKTVLSEVKPSSQKLLRYWNVLQVSLCNSFCN